MSGCLRTENNARQSSLGGHNIHGGLVSHKPTYGQLVKLQYSYEKAGGLMRFIFAVLFIGCLIPTSFGALQQPVHCPQLLQADIPLYPPVAWSAHFGGTVEIEVHVANGRVTQPRVIHFSIIPMGGSNKKEFTEAEIDKLQPYLTFPTLENLKSWRFQPEERAVFVVKFTYKIEGDETQVPENPRVDWELPSIKVIARPFKPTRS